VGSGRLTLTRRYLGSATAVGPGTRFRVAVTLSESTVDGRLGTGWAAADEASGSDDGVISDDSRTDEVDGGLDAFRSVVKGRTR
jgi:hypothetical protein